MAAHLMGRRWVGIDVSQTAIDIVEGRLQHEGAEFHTIGKAETLEELKRMPWHEFQVWAVNTVFGHHSPKPVADMGIDGFTMLRNDPIQVKQIEAVGRPEIDKFVGVLDRQRAKRGMMIALSFTKGAYEEVARVAREDGKHIELVECDRLLKGGYGHKVFP